jgi:hypothetical protein
MGIERHDRSILLITMIAACGIGHAERPWQPLPFASRRSRVRSQLFGYQGKKAREYRLSLRKNSSPQQGF